MVEGAGSESDEKEYPEWTGTILNASKPRGNLLAFVYGIEIQMFAFLPQIEVTRMQLLCQFFYTQGVPRS